MLKTTKIIAYLLSLISGLSNKNLYGKTLPSNTVHKEKKPLRRTPSEPRHIQHKKNYSINYKIRIGKILGLLPFRKILAVTLSILLLSVTSTYICISYQNNLDENVLSVSLTPVEVLNGDIVYLNVSVTKRNICSITVELDGYETIDLSPSKDTNETGDPVFWKSSWVVSGAEPGKHTATVKAKSTDNTFFSHQISWTVLSYANISVEEANALLGSQDIIFLDVRSQDDYILGHITNAVSLPLFDIGCGSCLFEKLGSSINDTIVVYDKNGVRSGKACGILAEKGFKRIYNMIGGLDAWVNAGLPVTNYSHDESVTSTINSFLEDDKPVFLMLYVEWCRFCRYQKPLIHDLEREYKEQVGFIYVDAEKNPRAMHEFGVTSFPTMFLISGRDSNGSYAYKRIEGAVPKEKLKEILDSYALRNDEHYQNVESTDSVNTRSSDKCRFNIDQFKVTSLPFGKKIVREDNTSIDVTTTGQNDIVKLLIADNPIDGDYVGVFTVNFTSDIDLSNIVAETNRTLKKSVIHNAAQIPQIINYSLLIPRVFSTHKVYICPGATSLAEVNEDCAGKIEIETGQTIKGMTLSEVTYDGEHYYLVENITGTGGAEGTNSNLTIWDDSDPEGGSITRYVDQKVNFFANYTNKTTGSPINGTGVFCEIKFFIDGGWTTPVNMTYNTSSSFYEHNRTFSSIGTYNWNVTCNGSVQGYDVLTASDNITINPFQTVLETWDEEDDAENKPPPPTGWSEDTRVEVNESTYFWADYTSNGEKIAPGWVQETTSDFNWTVKDDKLHSSTYYGHSNYYNNQLILKDIDVLDSVSEISFMIPSMQTGYGHYPQIHVRVQGTANNTFYGLFYESQHDVIRIFRQSGSSFNGIETSSAVGGVAEGFWYKLRFNVTGTNPVNLYGEIINISTNTTMVSVSSTDTYITTPGGFAVSTDTYGSGGGNPFIWDDFYVLNATNDATIFYDNFTGSCDIWFNDTLQRENMTYGFQWQLYFHNRSFNSTGAYTWNVSCSETNYQSQVNTSDVTVQIVDNPPTITLLSPGRGTTDIDGNVTFTCNAIDDNALVNLTLFVWNSTGGIYYTNTTSISGIANQSSWNLTGMPERVYTWNCQAYDSAGNSAWGDVNWTLAVGKEQLKVTQNLTQITVSTPTKRYVFDSAYGGSISEMYDRMYSDAINLLETTASVCRDERINTGFYNDSADNDFDVCYTADSLTLLENSSTRAVVEAVVNTTNRNYHIVSTWYIYPDKVIVKREITPSQTLTRLEMRATALMLDKDLDNNDYKTFSKTHLDGTFTQIPSGWAFTDITSYTEHGFLVTDSSASFPRTNIVLITKSPKETEITDMRMVAGSSSSNPYYCYYGSDNSLTFNSGTTYTYINKMILENSGDTGSIIREKALDFWNPANITNNNLTMIIGSSVTTDPGDSDADGFNEAEGIYVMNTSNNRVKFYISGETYVRYKPAFKIYNYTLDTLPVITLVNSSGTFNLVAGKDYNIDFKNSSEATDTLIMQYLRKISDNSQFTIGPPEHPPNIILKAPPNASAAPESYRLLNVTVFDSNNDTMCVEFFGDNTTNPSDTSLLYRKCNVANGTTLTYNWSSPVLKPDSSTVLLMHFDNRSEYGENGTLVYDFSGSGNNGTLLGPEFNLSGGKFAGAYYFDGVDDYIDVGNDSSLRITNEITIEAWIYATSMPAGYGAVVAKEYGTSLYNSYYLGHDNSGNYLFFLYTTDGKTWFSGSPMATNKWVHFAGVYNGSEMRIYVDCKLDAKQNWSGTIYQDNHPVFIGADSNDGGVTIDDEWIGYIDEVAIYNRSLSEHEIFERCRLKNGTYYWKVTANDSVNESVSDIWQFTVGVVDNPPNVTLISPSNAFVDTDGDVTFRCNVTDDSSIVNVSLYTNISGSWEVNQTIDPREITAEPSTVILMHFNNDSSVKENDTFVYDWSNNGNHGTCSGMGCPTFTTGKFGGAFEYDGYRNRWSVGIAKLNAFNGTVEVWVNPNYDETNGKVFSHPYYSTGDRIYLWVNNMSPAVGLGTGNIIYTSSKKLTAGQWYYLVLTWDNGTYKLYIDAELDKTGSYSGLNETFSPIYIGGDTDYVEASFNGTIDELAVYNRSLSATEIADHYNYTKTEYQANFDLTNIPNGEYKWNCLAYDASGNSNWGAVNWTFIIGNYTIQNLEEELDALLAENESVNAETTGQYGLKKIRVKKGTKRIFDVQVNFTKNLNWSNIKADRDDKAGKSFFHIPTGHPECSANRTLYVPAIYNTGWVYVCPNATSLDEVNESCPGYYTITGLTPVDNMYSINVTGTGAAEGIYANLTIWDDTDPKGGSLTRYPHDQVGFFANYTNKTTGLPINGTGVFCEIEFFINGSWTTPVNMTYNTSSLLYEYQRAFFSIGSYNWNVTCNGSAQGYTVLKATDNVTISNMPPNITVIYPGDGAANVDLQPTCSIQVNDTTGETLTIKWYENTTGTWKLQQTNSSFPANQISTWNYNNATLHSTIYWWKVNASDNYGAYDEEIYQFTTRSEYIPDPPSSFKATTTSSSQIDLAWIKGNKADITRIQRKTNNYPANISDGVNIYNGTGVSYSDTGLSANTLYYYRAWSFNATDKVWSTVYASAQATTHSPPSPPPSDEEEEGPPLDSDDDGTPDENDNCPGIYNPGQNDTDEDGYGDACDEDDDNDGWNDDVEKSYETDPCNPKDYPVDTDGDGVPDNDSPDGKYKGDTDDDNDNLPDYTEDTVGTDPKNKTSNVAVNISETLHYLIDTNNSETYNVFYNSAKGLRTNLTRTEDGDYLIDYDGDTIVDYIYFVGTGKVEPYEIEIFRPPPAAPGDDILMFKILGLAIIFNFIWVLFLYYFHRKRAEKEAERKRGKKEH